MQKETQNLLKQDKQEIKQTEERTMAGKIYSPRTDIYETEQALHLVMDMPGVSKDRVSVRLEKDVLSVEGEINHQSYSSFTPLYTEYNVGHYSRKFSIPNQINQDNIQADLANGVLSITLAKTPEVAPRRIPIN